MKFEEGSNKAGYCLGAENGGISEICKNLSIYSQGLELQFDRMSNIIGPEF